MPKFILAEKAADDVEVYRQHLINNAGTQVSNDFLTHIYRQFELIGEFPGMGRKRQDIDPHIHSFQNLRYKRTIFYDKTENGVHIIRVLSSYQNYLLHLKRNK